jgi:uncharacterized protein YacL
MVRERAACTQPAGAYNAAATRSEPDMHGIEAVDIAHAIQLALAPVFLLSGIAAFLGVLTNRLARVVDRARTIERELLQATAAEPDRARQQLQVMARRSRYMNVAITLATISGLLIALVVALLFSSTFAPLNLAGYVAVMFVVSMLSLVGAFLSFLLEVRIAIATLRIGGL